MSGRGRERLTIIRLPLQRSHALLDRAHHVAVEAVAVLAGVRRYDVGAVSVKVSGMGAAGLGGGFEGDDDGGLFLVDGVLLRHEAVRTGHQCRVFL